MKKNDHILIVIVLYNNSGSIIPCLDSIRVNSHTAFHLLLIDNHSADATLPVVDAYLRRYPEFRKKTTVIKQQSNVGFAASVNTGLRFALEKNQYLAIQLLNPDVTLHREVVSLGLEILRKYPDVGACGPKILYPDRTVWWAGTELFSASQIVLSSTYAVAKHIDKGKRYTPAQQRNVLDVEALTGCALLIRTSTIETVGLFNEKYFMYMEDIDYSQRLRKAGFRTVMFPKGTVIHNTKDKKIYLKKSVRSHIRKYNIYLTSVFRYLIDYQPLIVPIWLIKLPFALMNEYRKRGY